MLKTAIHSCANYSISQKNDRDIASTRLFNQICTKTLSEGGKIRLKIIHRELLQYFLHRELSNPLYNKDALGASGVDLNLDGLALS